MDKNICNPIEQRKSKPKIEQILPIYLDENTLRKAMDFVVFLKENKMNPGWRSPNSWCVSCKGKVVAYIKIGYAAYADSGFDSWQIVFFDHFNHENEGLFDEHTKLIGRSKIRFCERCANCKHALGISAKILGVPLNDNICCYMSMRFNNPTADELECIKKLVLANKDFIITNKKDEKNV